MIIRRYEGGDHPMHLRHDQMVDYCTRDEWTEIHVSCVMFTAAIWSQNMRSAAQAIAEARALFDEVDDQSEAGAQIIYKLRHAMMMLADSGGIGVSTAGNYE